MAVPRLAAASVSGELGGPLKEEAWHQQALALIKTEQFERVRSLNIVTESVHARRTRLMYEYALGPEYRVGVIAARARPPGAPDLRSKALDNGTAAATSC
jgi:hypothetical protein